MNTTITTFELITGKTVEQLEAKRRALEIASNQRQWEEYRNGVPACTCGESVDCPRCK